jgi:hypothetical protein
MTTDQLPSARSSDVVYLASRRANRALEGILDRLDQTRAELAALLDQLPTEMPIRVAGEALLEISHGLVSTAIDLLANARITEADFGLRLAQLNATQRCRRSKSEQLPLTIGAKPA